MVEIVARGKASTPYPVRASDVLWLMRAVEAEGPVQAHVAAVLVNGFTWARANGKWNRTLADWVRAYAQPVNPAYYPDGELFRKAYDAADTEDAKATLLRRAEARRDVHSKKREFTTATQKAVVNALEGRTKFPAEATDYARWDVDASGKGYRPLQVATKGQNRLWARPGTEGWDGYAVAGAGIARAFPWFPALLVAAALAVGVGYAVWRSKWGA